MALIGLGGTAGIWYEAVQNGLLYSKASLMFPAFLVIGVAATLVPGYREERTARGEDITGLQGWKLLTPRWRVILIAALIVGFGNYFLLRFSFNWSE